MGKMSEYEKERQFYMKHIYGPIKGRIQILNRNKQEIGFLKIKPLSKTYPLYFNDSNDPELTITEKRFSSKFKLYWGKETVEDQYIGSVKTKKSAFKIVYVFKNAMDNKTYRIKANLSGTKLRIDKIVKMKKKGKKKFLITIEPTTPDSRIIIYLAICSYLIMFFDEQNSVSD